MNDNHELSDIERSLKSEPTNTELLLTASRHYHRLAMEGDEEALAKGTSLVKRLLKIERGNVEALSIYGSLLTIRATKARSIISKIAYAIRASRALDKAIRLDSDNTTARTIRGFTSLVLPRFLKRLKFAVLDFEYLIERKRNEPSSLPEEMMPKIYFNLGVAYAKKGELNQARRVLSEVVSLFPETRECQRAKFLLSRIGDGT